MATRFNVWIATFIFAASGCNVPHAAEPPARLSRTDGDTIVINSSGPARIPIRALDANGRELATPLHYVQESGEQLPLTATGELTCTKRADVVVRARVGALSARVMLRCRPVAYLRIDGPVQFILGDPTLSGPRALPLDAYDDYWHSVALLNGSVRMLDPAIAEFRGLTVQPRTRGTTIASVHMGGQDASIGIHIYQRVESLAAIDTLLRLDPRQRLFAIPIRLKAGEYERQRLPAGSWMLTMLPEALTQSSPRLRIEGSRCVNHVLNTARRFVCAANGAGSVVIYRPLLPAHASVTNDYLLVRWVWG